MLEKEISIATFGWENIQYTYELGFWTELDLESPLCGQHLLATSYYAPSPLDGEWHTRLARVLWVGQLRPKYNVLEAHFGGLRIKLFPYTSLENLNFVLTNSSKVKGPLFGYRWLILNEELEYLHEAGLVTDTGTGFHWEFCE